MNPRKKHFENLINMYRSGLVKKEQLVHAPKDVLDEIEKIDADKNEYDRKKEFDVVNDKKKGLTRFKNLDI